MQCNVGKADQALRIVVGVALIVWGLFTQNWLGAVGTIFLLTGVVRWCPLYAPFKISTEGCCKGKK